MTNQISPRDWEDLSAYIDGQLAPKERQRLEDRLQTREDLRLALEELQHTRAIVRARLPVRAPRNFTLSPAMARIEKQKRQAGNLFATMRLASVLSSLLFVFVVLGDLWLGSRATAPLLAAEQPPRAEQSLVEEAPAAPTEAVLEVQVGQEAQPTIAAVAKALPESATATPEMELPLAASALSETYKIQPPEVGAGGGGSPESPDEAALADMAPSATATPLPTPSPTPTITPEVQPTLTSTPAEGIRQASGLPTWRWLELALILVSITTGMLAFYLYRAGRS